MVVPKFRAWDKNTKKMNGMAEIYRNRKQEIELLPRDDDIIFMQSTGLYDKNGVEIFEGDILKCTSIDGRLWHETNVSWDSTIAGFVIHKNIYEATSIGYLTDSKSITVEIIGNIYQNPELSEEKTYE